MESGKKLNIQDWTLEDQSTRSVFQAHVPGDITQDLFLAGLIEDPYFGDNYKKLDWVAKRDFVYQGSFYVCEEDLGAEDVSLVINGIDVFADVYVNDIHVCSTDNMFKRYEPNIKGVIHSGKNTVRVHMRSTINEMESINTEDYFGVFNVPRLFVRKAQCHFGWDWAPDLCGYGIWQEMYVTCRRKYRIDNVNYQTSNNGKITFFTELNYCINATTDNYGVKINGTATEALDDKLVYTVWSPDGPVAVREESPIDGKKNFFNVNVSSPLLWWPNGYGEQPLYPYEVTLFRDGEQVSSVTGHLAFREIDLLQEPTGPDTLGFVFCINGKKVYVRGSNWVPIDCFTGAISTSKYKRMISLAKNANFNLLRVWGGGVYEKDLFYDLCDQEGIMVWQDFMFACGDIPEDCPVWVENTLDECVQQMKRLRVHPSVVYWCGGNEKTGSYALQISRGDRFVDYTLHGLVLTMDRTRPYIRQSPFSYSDVGNNARSGETHCNSFEPSLEKGIVNYRETLCEANPSFYSECAVMGPSSLESFKKFMPKEKYWPINDLWNDRLRDNPYSAFHISFAERQLRYVTDLYGAPDSLEEFNAKGMLVHAEMLTAESDYARSRRKLTGGFITWMFGDIWPTGTWSCVDYYTEPKSAYYALKRAFEPIRAGFVQQEGRQNLFLMNDTLKKHEYMLEYGEKYLDGTLIWSKNANGFIDKGSVLTLRIRKISGPPNTYLFVKGSVGGTPVHTLYSVDFWRTATFESRYQYETELVSPHCAKVRIKAQSFVKALFLSFPDNYKYSYSDNYVDLEAGESLTITVTSDSTIAIDQLEVTDYASQITDSNLEIEVI